MLEEIGIQQKDTLLVINKVDALPDRIRLDGLLSRYPNAVPISAQTGFGLANLAAAVSEALSRSFLDVDVELGVENGRLMAYLAAHGEVFSKQFHDSRVMVHCRIPQAASRPHPGTILLAVRPHGSEAACSFATERRTNMKRDLQNSRAIVTGASSGIGRAVALELARHGAGVVVVARREDRLRELAEQNRRAGQAPVEIVVGDITDPATRQRALDAAQSKLGGLDILVNNAGVGAMGLFADASAERVRRVMETNFFALVEMTRLALPLLKQGVQPILVNVSSILGHRGVPYSSEYCASKFAVQGFSESIRAEFTRLGIDVLVVSPGTTETEFFDRVIDSTAEPKWPKHKPVSAAEVARQMVRAIRSGRHEIIPVPLGPRPLLAQSPLAAAGRSADGPVCLEHGTGISDTFRGRPLPGGLQAAGLADAGAAGHRQPGSSHQGVSASSATIRRAKCISASRTGSIGRRRGRWFSPRAAEPRTNCRSSSSIAR